MITDNTIAAVAAIFTFTTVTTVTITIAFAAIFSAVRRRLVSALLPLWRSWLSRSFRLSPPVCRQCSDRHCRHYRQNNERLRRSERQASSLRTDRDTESVRGNYNVSSQGSSGREVSLARKRKGAQKAQKRA